MAIFAIFFLLAAIVFGLVYLVGEAIVNSALPLATLVT